jgi:hypothetical protein
MKLTVEGLLSARGPALSTDLARILVRKLGLTPEAARKRVSRPSPAVKRLAFLTFPRNARFIYLQKDFGSRRYWDNLIKALMESKSSYGLALAALRLRGGIMPAKHFQIACGAPLRQKRHLSPETILERLQKAQLIGPYDVPGIGACIALLEGADRYDAAKVEIRARLLVEGILLGAASTWLKNLGIVSYGKVAIRDSGAKQPSVGTFAWDLTAPSYLGPILQWTAEGKQKQGFVACDVLLGTQVDEEGLRPFINKCVTLRTLKRVGGCLQMFIADHFAPTAFELAKKNGIIPATPETLFGRDVAEGLVQLFEVLCYATRSVDPEQLKFVFERLSRIEGAAVNLRGALFEYLVAEIVRRSSGGFVRIGQTLKLENGEKAEVDVVAEKQNVSVTFIECKGYLPSGTLSDQHIERWLEKSIPRIYEYARRHSQWKNLAVQFELWTTGTISTVARELIAKKASEVRPTRYSITVRDADGVRDVAQSVQDRSLLKIFNEHFFEHPLATAERDLERNHTRRARSLARKEPDDEPFAAVLGDEFAVDSDTAEAS